MGKTAIITGGTGELGRVVSAHLLKEGANIAVPYVTDSALRDLSPDLADPKKCLFVKTDLTRPGDVDTFVRQTLEKYLSLDILVNAAGGYMGGSEIREVSPEDMQKMMNLNLTTTFLMCRAALKVMQPRNSGRIITIAAMPALRPAAGRGPYAISKRAVITLTETIAEEVKGTGITANAIAPSIILTEPNRRSMPGADTGKWVTPEEIASLILYLCSDEARSVSGNVIKIFGGV